MPYDFQFSGAELQMRILQQLLRIQAAQDATLYFVVTKLSATPEDAAHNYKVIDQHIETGYQALVDKLFAEHGAIRPEDLQSK